MLITPRRLREFRGDRSGAVAAIFGLSLIVILVAMGVAIDSTRAYNASSKVQTALDVSALAAAKLLEVPDISDDEISMRCRSYFDAHLESMKIGGITVSNFRTRIDRSTGAVTASVDLVVPTLLAHVGGGLSKVSFSPEATVVYNSKKIEISLVLDVTGSMSSSGKINSLKAAAKEMVDSLFASDPDEGAIRIALVPYSASVNAGPFHTAVSGRSGTPDTCVVERGGADAFTDAAPGPGTYLGKSSKSSNSSYVCPKPKVVPLADLSDDAARAAFKASIDGLTPDGGTAGHIGTAWGWYMLSPKWVGIWPPQSAPRPASADVLKIVILMTDGEFNTNYVGATINSTNVSASGSSGFQALKLCEAMKAQAITIYSVAFMAPANAANMLRTCSGAGNFFSANDANELSAAFRRIADKLTSLRITS